LKVSDEMLMLFHDGELDAERARAVRVGRLHHSEVTARLEALGVLGDAVRSWAEQTGVDAAFERRRAARRVGRRRALGLGATLLAAVLAVPGTVPTLRRAGVGNAPADPVPSTHGEPQVASGPVAVEAVDFGAHPGAVFEVEGDAMGETTVVWLSDATADLGSTL
jgi:hypothetical protein